MTELKERELMCAEVLRENGISNREIARQLGVDESTIRYRLKRAKCFASVGNGVLPRLS